MFSLGKFRDTFECYLQQIAVRECLLPLGVEASVFQFAIQKFKDQDI